MYTYKRRHTRYTYHVHVYAYTYTHTRIRVHVHARIHVLAYTYTYTKSVYWLSLFHCTDSSQGSVMGPTQVHNINKKQTNMTEKCMFLWKIGSFLSGGVTFDLINLN